MTQMSYAMRLEEIGAPLVRVERPIPTPTAGEVLIEIAACGVCRTDLHVIDGEVPARLPIVPGHEIVGRVIAVGAGACIAPGSLVGVPWLGGTCGTCRYCTEGQENLCDVPVFTGASRDGGYATHVVADARFCLPLPDASSPVAMAPLLCAGLIGWRCLRMAGAGRRLGLYGFGAAAHILAQIAVRQRREVYAFTRPGDRKSQSFARSLGCCWVGGSTEPPPELLDAAIIFAPVGALVPRALRAVRKGGRVVCGGIHMSDIPTFPYAQLWGERAILSVANLTREDGREFLREVAALEIEMSTTTYPLTEANAALADLRHGDIEGAAVLVP